MAIDGESIAFDLPVLEIDAGVSSYFAELDLHTPTLTATGATAWGVAITLPVLSVYGGSSFGWDVSVDATVPGISATGLVGRTLSASLSFPGVRAASTGKASWSASITAPALSVSASGFTVIDWGSPALTLTAPELDAAIIKVASELFQTFCMNLRTGGVSEYTDHPLTAIVRFNSTYYGMTSDGIYELDGDTDAGSDVAANVLSGVDDYGSDDPRFDVSTKIKRSAGAYVNMRTQGEVAVVVRTDETKERVYVIDGSADPEGLHPRRVQMGRLLEGRNWQFGFKNVDGTAFQLKDFKNIPIVLSRRI